MNVAYQIEDVENKGLGIICKEFVKEGDVVYSLAKDTVIVSVEDADLEEYLKTVSDPLDCLNHGFCSGGKFIDLQFSDGRFCNHSFDPNTKYLVDREISVALRDILPEEEITENYWEYSLPENYDRLMKKHLDGNFRDHSKNWI